jgi:hypothetical protein
MSIEIIGSNDKKIKLITDNNIESILKNQEIAYNLYKTKYLNLCINNSDNNQTTKEHLLKQLINLFYLYDNNHDLIYNTNKFITYLNTFTNNITLLDLINKFFISNNILYNLELGIKKNIIKILKKKYNKNNQDIEEIIQISLTNNYYSDILYTLYTIKDYYKNNNNEIYNLITIINKDLIELDNYLNSIKIISLKNLNNFKKLNNIDNKNQINDCKFISNIINNLDLIILNNQFIKTNILKIDSIINIITENLYKLYLII